MITRLNCVLALLWLISGCAGSQQRPETAGSSEPSGASHATNDAKTDGGTPAAPEKPPHKDGQSAQQPVPRDGGAWKREEPKPRPADSERSRANKTEAPSSGSRSVTGPAIEQAEMPKATPTPETAPKKDPALVELRAALADKSEPDHVREYAARCIGKVGPDAAPAVPALIEALRDESPLVQRGAALALGDVGPLAKTAVPELKRLADKLKGIDWQAEVTNHISESYYAVRAEAMQCKPIVLADVEANVLFGIHIRDKQGKVIPAGFFELKYRHFTSYCGGMGMDMDKFKTKDTRRQPQYAYDMPSLRHAIRVAKLAAQGFYHGDQTTEASEFRRYRAAECARVRNHREAGFDSDTFLELEPRRAGRLGLQWECLVTEYHPGYDVKSYAFCVQWEALDAVERALASVGEVRE